MSGIVYPNRYRYEFVPAGAAVQVLGLNGRVGDYLHRLVISVDTPNMANVTLIDGPTIMPLVLGAAGLQRGPYSIEINIASRNGPWAVSTGNGATVLAVGVFS